MMETMNMLVLAVFAEREYINERVNRRGWLQPMVEAPRFRPALADLLLRLSTHLDPTIRQRARPTAPLATA
jgi:hypothetical protein